MASFDHYTNYDNTAGVSSVVYGAEKTVLEVELNEMQEISKYHLRNFISQAVGDGINNKNAVTYSDGKVKIASGCALVVDGIMINCSGLELAITNGTAYLQVWEETVDYAATLKEQGNQQDADTVSNWFKDNRSDVETTRRKVVKYTLANTTNGSRHNMAIASVTSSVMTRIVNEINLTNLTAEVADIKGYIGMTDPDIYGVEVDWANNKFTRLGAAVNMTAGADFSAIKPWQRKRCNVTDAGEVIAYRGDDGYTETGKLTQAIAIGAQTWAVGTRVQVMVEQNKFYYKMVPLSLEPTDGIGFKVRKARYYISATPKAGFKLFPAFSRNGVEVDKIYDSAFEGCMYDTSASTYVTDDSVTADYTVSTGDKLASIANAKPASGLSNNLTRANARKLANNVGTGWGISDFLMDTMTEWLFLIEYASMEAQSKIGRGNVDQTDDGSTNMALNTGLTSSIGDDTGMATGTDGKTSITYRGKENPFGNIWKWVDGLNYNGTDRRAYWADHGFADDTKASPYQDCGFTIINANGYISAFGWSADCDWAFLPTEVLGDSAKPVGDYFWQNTGWRVTLLGGHWHGGSDCGLCCWDLADTSSSRYRGIGSRLVYIPTAA